MPAESSLHAVLRIKSWRRIRASWRHEPVRRAEYGRVSLKYAPARLRDLSIYAFCIAVTVVASFFRDVDYWFFAGLVAGIAVWEYRKHVMRRNAREFA